MKENNNLPIVFEESLFSMLQGFANQGTIATEAQFRALAAQNEAINFATNMLVFYGNNYIAPETLIKYAQKHTEVEFQLPYTNSDYQKAAVEVAKYFKGNRVEEHRAIVLLQQFQIQRINPGKLTRYEQVTYMNPMLDLYGKSLEKDSELKDSTHGNYKRLMEFIVKELAHVIQIQLALNSGVSRPMVMAQYRISDNNLSTLSTLMKRLKFVKVIKQSIAESGATSKRTVFTDTFEKVFGNHEAYKVFIGQESSYDEKQIGDMSDALIKNDIVLGSQVRKMSEEEIVATYEANFSSNDGSDTSYSEDDSSDDDKYIESDGD